MGRLRGIVRAEVDGKAEGEGRGTDILLEGDRGDSEMPGEIRVREYGKGLGWSFVLDMR